MRRITAVVVGVVGVAGLAMTAGSAFAADGSTPSDPSPSREKAPVTMHLTCTQADTQITCSWDPADGAASYRIGEVYRHGRKGAFQAKTTTETQVTFEAKQAGHYRFVVQAVGADKKVTARSNKAEVTVKNEAPTTSTTSPAPAG